jgi:Domain of unknown function (DUF4190)/GYF domain 2
MYKIIGADGKEYGPATAEQLHQWIAEMRVNAGTLVRADDSNEWRPLGSLPGFTATTPAAVPSPIAPVATIPGGRKSTGMATTGLVFGILSVACCCGIPAGLVGAVFSAMALYNIKRRPDIYDGYSTAMIGLILSIASIILSGALFVAQLATDGFNFHWNFNTINP